MLVGAGLQGALERSGGGIVHRPHQASDVTRGRRFAPAFLEAAPRLAFKVDDEDIVLHDQHLSEVKIPMMPDFQGVDLFRQRAGKPSRNTFTVRQYEINEVAIGLGEVAAAL